MSLDIDSLAVEPALANEGSWADYAGGRFLIARYNNDKATQIRQKRVMENLALVQSEDPAKAEEQEKFNADTNLEVLSESILLNWEGLKSKGEDLPFSKEVARQYLADPRFSELRQFIENYSVHRGNFRAAATEEVAETVKPTAVV